MAKIKSFEYSELIDNFLYLGSSQTSKNLEGLKSLKITHIINLAGKCQYPSDFIYGVFHIQDGSKIDQTEEKLKSIVEFINKARHSSSNRVLIHCRAGMSRTPFVAIFYLITTMNINLTDAFNLVKTRRPQIKINEEFCKLLLKFDTSNSCTLEYLLNVLGT